MRKTLCTRLGLVFPSHSDKAVHHAAQIPDYMHKVVDVLLSYTHEGVLKQTLKDFTWAFLVGPYFTPEHEDRIRNSVVGLPIAFHRSAIDIAVEADAVVFRLDADDYMHPSLLQRVCEHMLPAYTGENIVVGGPLTGYIRVRGDHYQYTGVHIALGQAVMSSCGATSLHSHRQMKERLERHHPGVPVCERYCLPGDRLFIYNREPTSHSYALHQNPTGPVVPVSMIKTEFDMQPETATSRLELSANRRLDGGPAGAQRLEHEGAAADAIDVSAVGQDEHPHGRPC